MINRYIPFTLLFIFAAFIYQMKAQNNDSISQQSSLEIGEDGEVSFRYCGKAKRVVLAGDFLYYDEDTINYLPRSRRLKMHKGIDGCFHITTKPLSPETYTYCFYVNGKRKPDIMNNDTSWQKMHKWNVVSVGGTPQADLYLPPKQLGELVRTLWYSKEENLNRRVNIYLPAAYYSAPSEHFPVLYLLHGINGYEGSWAERGRAIHIMENLIEAGKAEPMIIVMPDNNARPHEDRPSHHTLFNNIMHYVSLQHDHRIEHSIGDLMLLIDSTYRVSDELYIAGLSDGARMAANIVNEHPNKFSAVGMFSPVVHKQQLPCDTCQNIGYYIYVGKSDMFRNNGKKFSKRLLKRIEQSQQNNTGTTTPADSITCYYTESIGGHNWRHWRFCLADFICRIKK